MRIAVGADVNGVELKDVVRLHLERRGVHVTDFTPPADNADQVDYPDIAQQVALAVASGEYARAVLVCGTGLGMAIVANKIAGVRAASVSDPYSAERARKSNDAQILCLGSLVVGTEVAKVLVDHWLEADFQGGGSARKVARICEIDAAHRSPVAQP